MKYLKIVLVGYVLPISAVVIFGYQNYSYSGGHWYLWSLGHLMIGILLAILDCKFFAKDTESRLEKITSFIFCMTFWPVTLPVILVIVLLDVFIEWLIY